MILAPGGKPMEMSRDFLAAGCDRTIAAFVRCLFNDETIWIGCRNLSRKKGLPPQGAGT